MAQIIERYRDGDMETTVQVRNLRNSRNLRRANIHMKARVYHTDDDKVARHPRCYHLYGDEQMIWDELRKRACVHFEYEHVADIPYDKIDEVNDYCIALIDEHFDKTGD